MLLKKNPSPSRNIIVVLGPTASGKSALGIALARRFRGFIISADSRQVYRGLDIGSAKVTKQEQRLAPHYLIDVASPKRQYTVAHFVRDARRIIDKAPNHIPIFIVGGSAFYISALLSESTYSSVPPNKILRKQLGRKSTPQLFSLLRRLDPNRAQTIDKHNPRRLIRAIEIARATSTTQTSNSRDPQWRVLKIGLELPRQKLYDRIDRRVDERIRRGMVREITRLHANGVSWKKLDAFGLEYRFMSRYILKKIAKPEAILALKGAIHDFTRRQLTWWRREADIQWIKNQAQATSLVKNFLAN